MTAASCLVPHLVRRRQYHRFLPSCPSPDLIRVKPGHDSRRVDGSLSSRLGVGQISLFVTLTVMPDLEPGIQSRKAGVWSRVKPGHDAGRAIGHSLRDLVLGQISLFVTLTVMPGLEPGIQSRKAGVWMAGSSPAMTQCEALDEAGWQKFW